MPGLDPGIHPSSQKVVSRKMDHRVKPGDDDPTVPANAASPVRFVFATQPA
jgi:hypothetical protein